MTFASSHHMRTHHSSDQSVDTTEPAGYQLRDLRKRAVVTQVELAKLLGIGQPRISAIERGNIDTLTVASVRAYVEALGGHLDLVARLNGADVTLRAPTAHEIPEARAE